MKIATWNVNGIRARESQFVEWAREDLPDVICLQEIKATPEQMSESLTMLPEYWSYWHGGKGGYSGVSIHVLKSRFGERPAFGHPPFDVEARVVECRLAPGLVVASIYVPNGGKDYAAKLTFLERMREYVETAHARGDRLVLCGDMNVARSDIDLHPKERKKDAIGQRDDERQLFERILASGLQDVARALHPHDESLFTWWAPWRGLRQKNQGWRIDYVLASTLGLRPIECRVLADRGTSDHAPLVAVLDVLPGNAPV
jgi:exodeoxyribonuclease-3